ncbi:Pimeloyl-ACP methyl ester carboxylesterase [Cognatiyoonia sediminum]|uniref:Pimeloyl-ACP methyl ester carboxylesterase n=1 Tax=Cognatiyoonia sediminum TaxID=1508389 RepID=A0A1M5SRG9_9RHOB|nr:alpha/beta hydrolase [Cognatiyoonia sediminum]SHH41085.1 Pimeloyl-ACP methyl ester carboxylesterase [Cognatiyoonia sediminum]
MTPLVFLPGMMCDERLFAHQIDAMSNDRAIHVAAFDGTHVATIAEEILKSAPPHFALAGLSMGGIVAMEILRQSPERVQAVALLDTNPLAETREVMERRIPQIEMAMNGNLEAVMRDEMKPNYLTEGPHRQSILDLCMDMALSMGPTAFIEQSRALQTRPDQTDTLRAYKSPTLILCGEEDTLCPVHRHTLMHELMPHSTLTILPNAGHLPTLEQPEATTAALQAWLKEIPNG